MGIASAKRLKSTSRTKRHFPFQESGVLHFGAGHWPPSKSWPTVYSIEPVADSLGRLTLSSGPLIGGWLLPSACFFVGLTGFYPAAGYITGTLQIAIIVPFNRLIIFKHLRG
jgi:hypothetical protein